MPTLLTYAGPVDAHALVTRTGGIPLAPAGFRWPRCATCDGPMQFLAQLLLDDLNRHGGGTAPESEGILSIFMCQNDPGLCDEWDPTEGGNRALLFSRQSECAAAPVPDEGATLSAEVCGVDYVAVDAPGYEEARSGWSEAPDRSRRDVLGQLGGTPAWLQGDETPSCPSCERPMGFVAQLEEGHDYRTAMNFAGGCGYAFACAPCGQGSFLWQS